jgi:hypothetical protein
MRKREWDLLFYEYDLRDVLEAQLRSINERVLKIPSSRFASESDEQLSASIASQLVVEPLELNEAEIFVSSEDTKVDVSHDFDRAVIDRSRPAYVDGIEVTYHVPYAGQRELLKCCPSTHTLNPPRAVLEGSELRFPYDIPGRDVTATKSRFLEDLRAVKAWIPRINEQVTQYNSSLEQQVRQRVVKRRIELKTTDEDLASLGFKIRATPMVNSEVVDEAPATRRAKKRERSQRQYDVALSFAGEDRAYVDKVAERLKELGVSVFYDRFEQVELWGKDLAEQLGRIYGKQSRFVAIFASRHYAAKAWPSHERQFALARHIAGEKNRILPVRFDATEIPGIASTIAYVDARVLTPEKLAELIRQKVDSDNGT